MNKRFKTIAAHIFIWLLYLLYDWLIRANVIEYPQFTFLELKASIMRVALLAATTYLILYKVYPNPFFKKNKWWLYGTLILITIISGIIIRAAVFGLVYCLHYGQTPNLYYAFTNISKPVASIVNGGFVLCVASMVYFTNQWQKQLRVTRQLEAAHMQAELELLRSQVKPHFIFNTLNNIYTLSLQQSTQTPQMIYRLSQLLRYMLYNSHLQKIPLDKELSYIDDYLELEKIRYNGKLDVLINRYSDTNNITIPPLLLLPLIENCIKHGSSQQLGLSWIRVDISTADNWLTVNIENSKTDGNKSDTENNGIGINNVAKRLKWIYKEHHSFEVFNEDDSFMVVLKLKYQ